MPAHTALLVIDLQRGAFDGVRCTPIDQPRALIGNAVRLLSAARDSGTPVVFVQHCEGPGEVFEEGSSHGELHEAMAARKDETVVRKRESSAFDGTELGATLQRLGATGVVVCGLQSEFCVSNTSKSALARGLQVTVAEDAHGTWPSKTETAGAIAAGVNRELAAAGATLRSTAALERWLREPLSVEQPPSPQA